MNQKLNCPSCKETILENNYLEKYLSDLNNQEYKLYHCKNCDLQFWWPLRIDLDIYEKEKEKLYILHHEGFIELQTRHYLFFKNFPLKQGKLLDIGCGSGGFLKKAEKLGFDVWGIDFDKKSIETAKKSGLKNVYPLSLEEFYKFAKDKNLKFDIITFFEVLEHQDNPVKFIEMAKGLLSEEGYIAGSVPHRDSIFINLYRGKYDKTDLPPHHFLRFSKKALINLFEKENFEIKIWENKSLSYLATLLEVSLIGKFTAKLKLELRKKIYKNNNKKNISKKIIFNLLKNLRTIIFSIICLIIYPFVKSPSLYFQGYIKK
jgi:2-polyprenyl-3-methyl-5-hydroxy-6-metoxy-1,4-benzoquinol methylase